MLDIILLSSFLALGIIEMVTYRIWWRSHKRSYERYVLKSVCVALCYLMISMGIPLGYIMITTATSAYESGLAWVFYIGLMVSGSMDLYFLSKHGDDDFFTKFFKKARASLKDSSVTTHRRHLAYVKP